jgi:hypothetical protein
VSGTGCFDAALISAEQVNGGPRGLSAEHSAGGARESARDALFELHERELGVEL